MNNKECPPLELSVDEATIMLVAGRMRVVETISSAKILDHEYGNDVDDCITTLQAMKKIKKYLFDST